MLVEAICWQPRIVSEACDKRDDLAQNNGQQNSDDAIIELRLSMLQPSSEPIVWDLIDGDVGAWPGLVWRHRALLADTLACSPAILEQIALS